MIIWRAGRSSEVARIEVGLLPGLSVPFCSPPFKAVKVAIVRPTMSSTQQSCVRCIGALIPQAYVGDVGDCYCCAMRTLALQIAGLDVPIEEAECLVANMIFKGYMRGYISHEKQMVVLANTNAFPRLADRASPYAVL